MQLSFWVPDNVLFSAIQAKTSLIANDYHRAVILFTKALYHEPDEAEFHKGKAMTFIGLGDLKSAVICLRRAAQLHPDDESIAMILADLYNNLGDIMNDDQDYNLANEYYAEALRLNPKNHNFWLNRIQCLKKSGKYQEAVECITEIIDGSMLPSEIRQSMFQDLILQRTQLYLKLERYKNAINDYKVVCRDVDKGHPRYGAVMEHCHQAALNLHTNAKAEVLMGKYSEAMVLIGEALQLSRDTHHYRLRSTIHQLQGNHVSALADLEEGRKHETNCVRAKQIDIERARVHNDLAVEQYDKQGIDAAINHLHHAIMLHPDQYQYYVNRADCNMKLQRYNHAQADYHEAVRLVNQTANRTDHQRIQTKLSTLHFQFGIDAFNRRALSEAASEFTEAIRLSKQRIAQYFISRAETFEQMQNVSMAISDYLEAVKIDPKQYVARDRLSALSAVRFTDDSDLPIRVVDYKATAAQSHVQQILARRNARNLQF